MMMTKELQSYCVITGCYAAEQLANEINLNAFLAHVAAESRKPILSDAELLGRCEAALRKIQEYAYGRRAWDAEGPSKEALAFARIADDVLDEFARRRPRPEQKADIDPETGGFLLPAEFAPVVFGSKSLAWRGPAVTQMLDEEESDTPTVVEGSCPE